MTLKQLSDADRSGLNGEGIEIIIFSAPWCVPCKATKPGLAKLSQTSQNGPQSINVLEVDGEENPVLMREYHVRAFPTMVLIKNGQPEDTLTGGKTFDQLRLWVESKQ